MNEKDRKIEYLAKNTLLFAISTFGTKLLSFLLIPLYTGVLNKSEYGIADIITTTSILLCYIFSLNIADSVLRFGIEEKEHPEQIFLYGIKVVAIGGVISGICILLLSIINPLKWDKYCYLFLFLNYFLSAINDVSDKFLRSLDKVKEVAISAIILTSTTIVSNIVCLLLLNIRLKGFLFSTSIGFAAAIIYRIVIITSKPNNKWGICNKKTKQQMLQYSIPLIFNGIIWWMNGSLDRYFLIGLCGTEANGLYSVASKIPTILSVCSTIFLQAWGLSAMKAYDKKDTDGFFTKTYSVFNGFLIIAASLIILFNILFAKFLFSGEFFEAWKYSSVLVFSGLFSAMAGFTGSVFDAAKSTKIYAYSSASSILVNIVLNAALIPNYGIQGATIATATSFFVIWLVRFIAAKKYIEWKINVFRDVFCYALIITQIVFEHMGNHMYFGQIAVFSVLCMLYFKEIKLLLGLLSSIIKKVTNKHNEAL